MHVRPSALASSGLYALYHRQDGYQRRSHTGSHGTPRSRVHRPDTRPSGLHHGVESCRRTRVRSLPFASRSPRPWDLLPLTAALSRSPPFAIGSYARLEVDILLSPRLLGCTRTSSHMRCTFSGYTRRIPSYRHGPFLFRLLFASLLPCRGCRSSPFCGCFHVSRSVPHRPPDRRCSSAIP